MRYLTPHFTLDELVYTDHRQFDNTPPPEVLPNLMRLANLLEQVRVVVGAKPIIVNSGYRSAEVNAAVGSKPTSQHRKGCAADIRVPGMTPDDVVHAILRSGIVFDQLIKEFDRWTHISVPNEESDAARKMALIIDSSGTRLFA